jgi:hypothetical protein
MRLMHRIGWIGLTLVGCFMVFAVASDLRSDQSAGIPNDHAGTFEKLSGQNFAELHQSASGVAHYVTRLEVGYALHELTFAVLFLFIVLVPLRQGRRWAWWACWVIMIANVGYLATFGVDDSTTLTRSLIVVIAVPVLLALSAPYVFGPHKAAIGTKVAAPAPSRS